MKQQCYMAHILILGDGSGTVKRTYRQAVNPATLPN
jgi:hypothetical protein